MPLLSPLSAREPVAIQERVRFFPSGSTFDLMLPIPVPTLMT